MRRTLPFAIFLIALSLSAAPAEKKAFIGEHGFDVTQVDHDHFRTLSTDRSESIGIGCDHSGIDADQAEETVQHFRIVPFPLHDGNEVICSPRCRFRHRRS